MKYYSSDDETTLLMNVWMQTFLECGCTQTAIEKADHAEEEFRKRFLSKENSIEHLK